MEESPMTLSPFHLALPVSSKEVAKDFYHRTLGFSLGREDKTWIDIDFYGHQLVFHETNISLTDSFNPVDKENVPIPHFGIVLNLEDWEILAIKLKSLGLEFIIEPTLRFQGMPGEQATLFFKDPNGLNLEFKAMKDLSFLFARN